MKQQSIQLQHTLYYTMRRRISSKKIEKGFLHCYMVGMAEMTEQNKCIEKVKSQVPFPFYISFSNII